MNVVLRAKENVSNAALGQIVDLNLKRIVQRQRIAHNAPPPNPASLEELVIPHNYQMCPVGRDNEELFLLYDSGAANDRILVFGTERNLDFLQLSDGWYADGTFKVAPPLFRQLYTIHGERFGKIIPAIYALLPNKREETYVRLMDALLGIRGDLQPLFVMTDFEVAALNMFNDTFPFVNLVGCYFHFSQCIFKRIHANGLSQRYRTDEVFALQARMIAALAFVPPDDVVDYFEILEDGAGPLPAELRPVLDYLEDT